MPPMKAPRLDAKDWRILHELDRDAAQPLARIAKKLHVGRDVLHYRVKRLEEQGIIKKYITVIDFAKVGYLMGALYLKFRHEAPEMVKEIIEYYKQQKEVWWLLDMEGEFDLAFGWFATNISALRDSQRKLMEKYRKHVQDFKFRFYNKFYHFRKNYLSPGGVFSSDYKVIQANVQKITDETDDRILRILSENARMGYVEIANRLGLTAAQVHYRMKKLKEQKVILGSKALLDLKKIGYEWYKLDIYLDDYSVYDELLKFVSSHPNVIYAYDAFGGADLELDIEVRNYEEFKKLEDTIKSKFADAIEKTDFIIFTREHKLIYFPA